MFLRGLRRRRRTLAVAARSTFVLAALAALSGCGIPSTAYLAPPEHAATSPSLATTEFIHNADNDVESFAGYEVYYKIYLDSVADEQFAADREAIESSTTGFSLSELESRGFSRVVDHNDPGRPAPLLTVSDASEEFTIQIVLPSSVTTTDPGTAIWPVGQSVDLGRTSSTVAGADPELFLPDQIDVDDTDTPDGIADEPVSVVAVAIVLLAYGIDYSNFTEVYSIPTVASDPLQMAYLL